MIARWLVIELWLTANTILGRHLGKRQHSIVRRWIKAARQLFARDELTAIKLYQPRSQMSDDVRFVPHN
jgi:hypothetical protein